MRLLASLFFMLLVVGAPQDVHAKCADGGETDCFMDNAHDEMRDRILQGLREMNNASNLAEKKSALKEMLDDCQKCFDEAFRRALELQLSSPD